MQTRWFHAPKPMQWRSLALYCLPALLAALLWATGAPALDGIGAPVAFILGALGCILAVQAEVYIEVRKQTFAVSVNDIPLSVGLIVLTPLALLLARVLAKCVMLVMHRASPGKTLFNLGVEAFEVAVAVAIVDAVSTNGAKDNPVTWLAVVLGVVAADLAGSSLIALAIRISERRVSRRQVMSLLVPSACFGVLGTAIGLLGVLVISVNPWAASLLLVVFAVGTYGHRAYRRFLSQHERLDKVYGFSQRVEESRAEPEAIGELLEFFRETLNART
ncbi:MAG: hypothetical protein J2P17_18470, partial [Mycobacterium sp.]|nr:hypothetical protein [Mycobacterium sp.]